MHKQERHVSLRCITARGRWRSLDNPPHMAIARRNEWHRTRHFRATDRRNRECARGDNQPRFTKRDARNELSTPQQ
jgi:hypothetical protein